MLDSQVKLPSGDHYALLFPGNDLIKCGSLEFCELGVDKLFIVVCPFYKIVLLIVIGC